METSCSPKSKNLVNSGCSGKKIVLDRHWFREGLFCFKRFAKRFPLLAGLNQVIKARQLRAGLLELAKEYSGRAAKTGFTYSEEAAWTEARRRLATKRPTDNVKTGSRLRIFWVGANRDQDESGFLQALHKFATVNTFQNWRGGYGLWLWDRFGRIRDCDPEILALNESSLVSQLKAVQEEGPIDLLMGQMWANYVSNEALAKVHELGIPVVNVSMDDRLPDNWKFFRGTRKGAVGIAPSCDLVLTTSNEACLWYALERCPAIFWPLASDPDVFEPKPGSQRNIDVLFIGNRYGIRERIIHSLKQQGIHVECYGQGWPNGSATAEQSAALFGRARIILGIGTVGHCDDVFTMKLRDFDAPMAGGLYLTHRSPDLARLYQEGTEIECYSEPEEAARKIKHYLAHPDELAAIASAGHAKAIARDTWEHRLRWTLEGLGLLPAEDDRV